ncbi:hypothetical protein R3Q06_35910, partial [Rhodococcus erythropolis]|nr:hypothetical protein [Rhodococcus erythropolis]
AGCGRDEYRHAYNRGVQQLPSARLGTAKAGTSFTLWRYRKGQITAASTPDRSPPSAAHPHGC